MGMYVCMWVCVCIVDEQHTYLLFFWRAKSQASPGSWSSRGLSMAATLSMAGCPLAESSSLPQVSISSFTVSPSFTPARSWLRMSSTKPAVVAVPGGSVLHCDQAAAAGCVRRKGRIFQVTCLATESGSGSGSGSSSCIQFIRGIDEQSVPDVKLTRSRDGNSGVATFVFDQPSVFDSSRELGEITGIYMVDSEGVLSSVDVSAKFVNGKPAKIEARYVMRNVREWDRFMRFMERYANENNLGFVKT